MTDERAWQLAATVAAWTATGYCVPVATPLSDDRWRTFLGMIGTERLAGPLARAVQDGRVAATEEQADACHDLHRRSMATALLLDRTLLEVVERLAADGVEVLVLKGSAAAHLDYESPSLRSYGDVDLLVEGDRMDAARVVLEGAGGQRLYVQRQSDFDRRFTKSVTVRMPNDVEVDLHRTLAPGPFGLTIDLEELVATPEPFVVGGVSLVALARSRRFVHSCYHATLGRARTRLVPLCDVVATAPRDEWELHAVDALVRHWACQLVVQRALDTTTRTLGWEPVSPLRQWRAELRSDRQKERWLTAYSGADRSDRRLAVYSLEALPHWPERISYGSALARSSATARHLIGRATRARLRSRPTAKD